MEDREIIEQGRALRAIRHTPGFQALEALIERKNRDLFARWAAGMKENGRDLSREWADGYMACSGELVSGVDEMIRLAGERDPTSPEAVAAMAGSSPLGRGELAL